LVERDCRSSRGRAAGRGGRESDRWSRRSRNRPLVDEVPRVEEIEEPTAGRKGLPVESRKGRLVEEVEKATAVEEVEKATAGRGGRSATVTRPGAGAWGFEPAAST